MGERRGKERKGESTKAKERERCIVDEYGDKEEK